jgi:hypothetical protein
VLLGGLILLAVAGILLLQHSRPRAAPANPDDERDSPERRSWQRPIRLPAGGGGESAAAEDEETGPQLTLKVVDELSGAALAGVQVGGSTTDADGTVTFTPSEDDLSEGLTLEREGYGDRHLSAEELAAMVEVGQGMARLAPLAALTVRLLDAQGRALEGARVCLEHESDWICEYGTSDTVEITSIAPGEHLLRASASPASDAPDAGGADHVAYQTLRLAPGEHRRVDLQSSGRLAHRLTVELVDAAGKPLQDIRPLELELSPRQSPQSQLEQAQLAAARESQSSTGHTVSWTVERPGWYRVVATPRIGTDREALEVEQFVEGDTRATLRVAIPYQSVRCALVDEAGHELPFTYYRVSIAADDSYDGFGGGGSPMKELRFYWPPGASSITVRLGLGGRSGKVRLTAPEQRCEARGRTAPADE